jgi:hypothetical protein
MLNDVKRAGQTDGNQPAFACKWYASTARLPGAQDLIGPEQGRLPAITFSSVHIHLGSGI